MERIGLPAKGSVSLIQEQQRTGATHHQQVLQAGVAKIRKQGAGRVVQYTHPGVFCYVLQCAVAAVAIEPVGQASRLRNVEIIEAVVVVIARSYSVVAVKINPAGSI